MPSQCMCVDCVCFSSFRYHNHIRTMHDQCTSLGKNYAISPQQTTQTCKIIFIKAVRVFFFLCRSRIGHISPVGIMRKNMPINTLLHLLTLLSCIEWFKAWTSGKTTFSIKLVPNISEVLCRFEFYPGPFFFSVSTISCHSVYLNLPKKKCSPFLLCGKIHYHHHHQTYFLWWTGKCPKFKCIPVHLLFR